MGVQSGSFVTGMDTVKSTVTLPGASVALGFNAAATTTAASQKTEGVASTTAAASHSETATGTSAIASATKTGGASEAFVPGNSGLILGAAMAGLALLQ